MAFIMIRALRGRIVKRVVFFVFAVSLWGCKQDLPVSDESGDTTNKTLLPQEGESVAVTPWDRLMGEQSLRTFSQEELYKLEPLARDGNAIAQANWAVVLGKGIGREPDTDQAVEYFIKAAEQGLDYIQFILGFIYENGVMVEKDIAEALRWYQIASDQGNAQASLAIAVMYQTGRDGIPVDEAKTFQWMRKSAEQGNPFAQTFLGTAFSAGIGVPKDKIHGLAWLDLARSHGFHLSGSVRERLLNEMSPKEKNEAQKLTEEWRDEYPLSPSMEPIF